MSELKARLIDDTYVEYYKTGKHELAQVYIKAEADKVIAEKDAKIIQLKALIENYNRISGEIIDNANHQKYKRCLAMAAKSLWKRNYWRDSTPAYERQHKWENMAYKHYKRWLAIAEKFKEAK